MARTIRTVSLAEFGEDWGVTRRTVGNWAAAGMPTRLVDGERRVKRPDANRWVAESKIAEAIARQRRQDDPTARLRQAQAELAELDLEERRREVIRVEEAAQVYERVLVELRHGLLSFPARLAPILLAADRTLPALLAVLDAEIRKLFERLSGGADAVRRLGRQNGTLAGADERDPTEQNA